MNDYHEDLALRLIAIEQINGEWRSLDEKYGAKVARELRKIAPSDPSILYDLVVISLIDDGNTEEEAIAKVDNYTPEEWQHDLDGFIPTITNFTKKALEYERTHKRTK